MHTAPAIITRRIIVGMATRTSPGWDWVIVVSGGALALLRLLGLAALLWGLFYFPVSWSGMEILSIAGRIVEGHSFRAADLSAEARKLEAIDNATLCNARLMRASAVIRLQIAEKGLADRDRANEDQGLRDAARSVYAALRCVPSDAFLWTALYWIDSVTGGASARKYDYLRMSYEWAPNEGWIAVRRNPLALAEYDNLPSDLQLRAEQEFQTIVRSGLIPQAADTLISVTAGTRTRLLARVAAVDQPRRVELADALAARGHWFVIPGVERRPSR